MTDSSALGYLVPSTLDPAEDIDLDRLIQPVIVGITGMDDALVRIKGQPIPPKQPGRDLTWCAFGTRDVDAPAYADEVHVGWGDYGNGVSRMFRQEDIEVIASFYGPSARSMAARLRDGFSVSQNRDAFRAAGFVYVRTERMTGLADSIGQEFVRRTDLVFRLCRMVGRTYPIRNVEDLAGIVVADGGDADSLKPVVASLNTGD